MEQAPLDDFLTPGSDQSVSADASANPGSFAQKAYSAEYNALGIKTNPAIPLVPLVWGNNAGIRGVVGSSSAFMTTPGPISTSNNLQSSANMGFLAGIGWWMGFDKGVPKMYIGNYPTAYIAWDGTTFTIQGDFIIGNTITLRPGDNIQAALNSLASTGGIVYLTAGTYNETSDIAIPTGVSLIGSGVSNTIIDFGSTAHGIVAAGTISVLTSGFTLSGFTLQHSAATAAINITAAQNFIVSNIEVTLNTGIAISIDYGFIFRLDNLYLYLNSGTGLVVKNTTGISTLYYISNVSSWANGGHGFDISTIATPGAPESATLFGCFATQSTNDGFHVPTANVTLVGCSATTNGDSNFNIIVGSTMTACISDDGITFAYASTITLQITNPANPFGTYETTTVNATGNATINASGGGNPGQEINIIINNDATSGKVITFGTHFRSTGTITGTTSKAALISFISDGTSWFEKCRTLLL